MDMDKKSRLQDAEFVAKPFRFKDKSGLPKKKRKTKVPKFPDGGGDSGDGREKRQCTTSESHPGGWSDHDYDNDSTDPLRDGGQDGNNSDMDQADEAFEELVDDALNSPEGAFIWERVFGEPISHFPYPSNMSKEVYIESVKARLYEVSTSSAAPPGDGDEEGGEEEEEEEEWDGEERTGRWYEHIPDREETDKEVRDKRKVREDAEIMARIQKLVDEENERKRELEHWSLYLAAWRGWDGAISTIPWPVRLGRREDVMSGEGSEVRKWFLEDWGKGRIAKEEFVGRLKGERVRWHPDRFCRRFGGQDKVERELVRDVTVVFQVLGGLWEEAQGMNGRTTGRRKTRW